ncbi:MAG: hypothetical protein CMF22_10475 [Idiomarinaceae bacterium]|nr:hypothetical protein [Idiomarinaceae bacterium]MBG23865.1 hypothetical protein [Idiomarinaceae bacterium]|tara:strand:- start:11529 stop:13370 length:1842 start_codon:yes stop_codon:yes gene_type:complete
MKTTVEKREAGHYIGGFGCFDCGGSDPLAIYRQVDGSYTGYCFSNCDEDKKYKSSEEIEDNFDTSDFEKYKARTAAEPITDEQREEIESNETRGWRERKITRATSEAYGVYTKFADDGSVINRYYPVTENKELVGYHVRNDKLKQAKKKDKSIKGAPFYNVGKVKLECELFGQSLFSKGGKFIVITGGCEDAMAVYQTLKTDKYETACVSPVVGEGSAVQQVQNNFQYVNSFEKVILMMDNDEVGKKAALAISKLFGFGKVVIADLTYKDPCEYLQHTGGAAKLRKAFWEAMPKRPSQVLTVADIFEKAMKLPEMGLSMPWPSATEATLGIRRGEIHIVGAAPKIGKTEHQHQLIKHMTDVHGEVVGVMSLEENPVKTLKKVAGKYAKKQFTKPPQIGGYTLEEMEQAFKLLDHKMEFYSSDGVRDYMEILDTVRYWASKGIWFFILDPLTALVAEYSASEANDILNNFMSKAASLCMELGVTFFMYSHVNPVKSGTPHDQGGDVLSSQFTGSRAMEKWAHYGWGIQRDRTEKDEKLRNTARVTLLFDREFGEYCEYYAFYDKVHNDWSECDNPNPETNDEILFDDGGVSEDEDVSMDNFHEDTWDFRKPEEA